MAHSIRHTAIIGHTTARSEKADKRHWNRRVRHLNRVRVLAGQECVPWREVTNVSTGAKDGKQRFDPTTFPQGLRK